MKLKVLFVAAISAVAVLAAPAMASASSDCYTQPPGCVSVDGYFRSDGTYIAPYFRNYPDSGPASRGGYVPTTGYAPTTLPKLRHGYFTRAGDDVLWHFRGVTYKRGVDYWRVYEHGYAFSRPAAGLKYGPSRSVYLRALLAV